MNKRLVPKLRFKEFNDKWSIFELSKISLRITDKNKDNSISSVLTDSAKYGVVNQRNFFKKDIANSVNTKNYIIVKNNDFIYNPRISNFAKYGPIRRNKLGVNGIVSPLYSVFRIVNNNITFLENYFLTSKWHKFIYKISNTGARADRMAINISDFYNMQIPLPTLSEQQYISAFFTKMDRIIELQSKKITHFKQLKKGYLQKMFPQKDDNVPRLRFDGFSDAWNKKKLNDLICKGKSGGTPSTKNNNFYNGNINFLSISDMKNANGIIKTTEKMITQKGLNHSSAWIVPKGAITLSMYASVGKVAKLNINLATSQAFFNMLFNNSANNDFMYYFFQIANIYHLWSPLISTGTQQNLNATKIKSLKLFIPSIQEQNKIGKFFKKLDQSITQQENKLIQLKQLKKAYLQKMFC